MSALAPFATVLALCVGLAVVIETMIARRERAESKRDAALKCEALKATRVRVGLDVRA